MPRKMSLLIVDDRKDNLFVLESLVKEHFPLVEIFKATNAAEGIGIAAEQRVDGALIDVQMPRVDGIEMCRRLKHDESTRHMALTLLTSHSTTPELRARGLEAGADDFIHRPFDNVEFAARVKVMLRVKRAEDELREMNERLEARVTEKIGELRESEEKYRALYDNAPLSYEALDEDGCFLDVNPAWLRTLGYEREEVIGRCFAEFLHPDWKSHFEKILSECKRRGHIHDAQFRIRHKDGHFLDISIEGCAGYGPDGSFHQTYGVFQDITERKRAEEEREELEAQLNQSRKLEAVGQLAGGVAHDFNNLLMIILGQGQVLLEGRDEGDPERSAIEQICQAGNRAADLTRQLLAFSRKQVLQPRVLDLNDLVGNVAKMLRRLIGEDVELRTVLGSDLWRIKADPGQIEQVLLNLAVNARDAMPQGGLLTIETADVQVDAERADRGAWQIPPGPYVQLSVSDSGVGMGPDVVPRIFEPFFTTKEMGKGTGLGLASVYGIIKQSGGSIMVYSEPDLGTTFKIYLPRVEAPADHGAETVIGAPEVPGGTETILLAEDDRGVRAMVAHQLSSCGYQVLEAANSEEALGVAANHPGPVALLLADVVMPGGNGPELAARLQSVRPDTRALFMSGYTDGTVARHGVLPEGMAFLQKPFSRSALARKVREVLDG